ncbi:MAG: hypothetical protein LBB56_03275, partial [Chitinispirillales bacterium]|nr:hypothetical protein [Chitinispirillales bacterium]
MEAADTETKYSLNCQFEKQFNNWLKTFTPKERLESTGRFLMGITSNVLKSIGVNNHEIYWNT